MTTPARAKAPRRPTPGRPTGRFTQHRRLDKLREALEGNPGGLSIAQLAQLLRITTRSVRRYLRELDRQTEVESVATKPGGAHVWRIKPAERGRAVTLRRTQAYGLLATRGAFEVLRGSALYHEMDVAFRQLLVLAQRPMRIPSKGDVPADQRLEERFLVVPPVARTYVNRGEELDDLFQAVASARRVRFRYRGPPRASAEGVEAPRVERCHVEPYGLVLQDGTITCVGRDVARNEVRTFALEAISETDLRDDEGFVVPADFRLADCVHGDFGVVAPGAEGAEAPATRAIVEFDPRAAEEVRARRYHPSQKLATAPDGRVRVSISLPELGPLVPWILSFGPRARAIEPPALVEQVAAALRATLGRYGVTLK